MSIEETIEPTYEQQAAHVLVVAERLLDEVLPVLRMLTPEGWNMAYFQALGKWHTMDMTLLKEARLLSMRASQKWPPPSMYPRREYGR